MKVTIESTTKIVSLNGIDCRVWDGTTERGVPIVCFIPRVAVRRDEDESQLKAELEEQRVPSPEVTALPLRMIL